MKTNGTFKRIQLAITLFLVLTGVQWTYAQSEYRITESYLNHSGLINYIVPDQSWAKVSNDELPGILKSVYGLTYEPELKIMKESSTDRYEFQRFYQMYGEAYVYASDIIVKRDKSGTILAIVGTMHDVKQLYTGPVIPADTAVVLGIDQVGQDRPYMWNNPLEEEKLHWIEDDSNATYYPTAQLVYYPTQQEPYRDFILCYEMELYTTEPARYFTYVEASTGNLVYKYNGIAHANSAGATLYNGNKNFSTGKIGVWWYLHDSTRKIFTVDARSTEDFYWQIRDGNNNFNANWQKEGVSAHWACGKALDYYKNKLKRNSLDGKGGKVMQTVRYDTNYDNAFWSGKAMYYGSGNGTDWGPLVAVDDVGHESSHGTIQFTANLIYQGESGALNEGWADIFGMTIENYTGDKDWNQSEDSYTPGTANDALRVMNNPNTTRDPDSYKGKHWKSTARGASDHGGVHSNSGVANYWFYLLTDGGSGKSDGKGGQKDMGNDFNVTGIGIAKSEQIAYRALNRYMATGTDYAGARIATLLAAEDLHGKNSNEYKQVCNAWYAVDVGEKCCPDSMEFEFDFTEPLCHDSKDGKIDLTIKKATGPFEFAWYENDTLGPKISSAEDLTGVKKGTYVVVVKDTVAKCEKMEKVELKGPEKVTVSISGGGLHIRACDRRPEIYLQATGAGGTPPYTYNWNNGRKVIATTGSVGNSGWYTGEATDKNGCKGSRTTFAFFIPIRCSYDPNDIIGPPSYGDQKWVSVDATLPYKVRFENDPKFATAPAQKVTIDHPLDSNTDLGSFRLGDFGFASYVFQVPENSSFYAKRLDLRDSLGIYLDVTAGLNIAAKKAFWIFESIDPVTGLPPADANVGFLAVNDTNTRVGEGFVDYTIKPKSTAVTGDSIRAIADIVFDNNPAILTPKIHNLIDAVAPTSGIRPLPGLLDSVNIPITMYGEDDSAASGFAAWDLYVSENGGAYTLEAQGITDSVTTYRGNYGHEYRFYTLGLDNVSNKEDVKTTADLTITIAPDQFLRDLDSGLSLCALDTIDVKWNYLNIPSFDLEYTADSGATFNSVAQNLDPGDSIYSWIIPATIQGQKNYWLRAVASSTNTPIDTSRFFELKEIPDLDLGPDTSFCDGTAFNLVLNSGGGFSSYLWSTTDTTSSYTATSAGTYSLTVGNTLGCYATDEVVVGTYLLPEISSKTITDATCNGASDGGVSIVVVSGNAPYRFSWSSGDSTQNISGKTANMYVVTITDSVQCVSRDTSIVGEPNVLASTPGLKHVSCFGGSDAEIDLNTAGGTSPYTYAWSNGDTTDKITGLAKGVFTVITTDANSCARYDTITITEPNLLVASHTADSVSCYQGSDGSVNLTVTGGTTNYSYLWSNADTTQDISGLTEGTYTVVVTDANGCLAYDTAQVHEPLELQATAALTHVSCKDGSDGAINLSVTGGTTSYSYVWSNTSTTQDISALVAGTYSVIVTDANSCVAYDTSVITEPPALTITHSLTHVSCKGGADGKVNITVGGGTPGYTYAWSNSDTTEDISSLIAGTYDVLVTDANACTIRDTGTVTEPPQLTTSGSLTMVSCHSGSDGEIDLSVTGGTAPYTYLWSTTDTTQDVSGLSAGTYTVLVTDAKACIQRDTFIITQPNTLSGIITVNDISCFGLTDGSMSLSMSGGVSPYRYAWSNGDTTSSITALGKGSFTVIVTDANSCLYYDTAAIAEPAALAISHSVTDVSCKNGSDGKVDLTVSGGTMPYRYSWSNGDTTKDLSSLIADTYDVLVTDDNGCTIRDTATVTEPSLLTSSGTLTMVLCNGDSTGEVDLSVSGGTAPYTYVWSNTDTTQDVSKLIAGTYTVIITDANSCQQFDTFTITQPTAMVNATTVKDISCFGVTDGSLALSVSGGVSPYRYLWSNSDTTATITGLAKGSYTVIITDANGCELYDTSAIAEPTAISIVSSITHVSCFGGSDGAVDLTTSGGTTPYKWLWSNSDTTEDVSGLSQGRISVIITDANGCQYFDTMTITEPTLLTSTGSITHVKCNGDATGAVDLTPGGGTSPYRYIWSNSDTTEDVSSLTADTYYVTITDAKSCTAKDTFTVNEPALLTSTVTSIPTNCYDSLDGTALVTVSGGVTPYKYLWNNNDTNAVNANVGAGSHSVIITDSNGCMHYDTVSVTQPPVIQIGKTISPVSCNTGNDGKIDLTVTGGTPNYRFAWSTSDTTKDISALSAGTYSVIVTDDNGCVMLDTSSVTEPTPIVITKMPEHLKCNNDSTGRIDLSVTGGTPGYTFQWSNTSTTEDISKLMAGEYSVIVTDANLCNAYDTTLITQPDSLKAVITHTDLDCYGDGDGTVDLSVTGGTMPYKYKWNNGDTTQNLSNLSGGEYSVIVTDSNSCVWYDTVNVVEPGELMLVLDSIPEKEGQGNGKAWVTVTGGVGPYEYLWNDPNASTTDTAFNLSRGVYTVTVTDANDCEAVDSILVPMTVGIGIINPGDVAIYPNPNQGWVGIYNLNVLGDNVQLIVTDARGSNVLMRAIGNTNDYQLNLPHSIVEGTYILTLHGSKSTVRKHMVLIR